MPRCDRKRAFHQSWRAVPVEFAQIREKFDRAGVVRLGDEPAECGGDLKQPLQVLQTGPPDAQHRPSMSPDITAPIRCMPRSFSAADTSLTVTRQWLVVLDTSLCGGVVSGRRLGLRMREMCERPLRFCWLGSHSLDGPYTWIGRRQRVRPAHLGCSALNPAVPTDASREAGPGPSCLSRQDSFILLR